MVSIPGFAVSLFGLVAVFVAFGLIQLTRYWLRPILTSLAVVLKVIPVVGGFLSRQVLRFERIVDGWLAHAALATERIATGYLHGLTTLFARLGEQIAGLALDAFHSISGVVRVTIPRLIRAAEGRLLRLIRSAEHRIVLLGRSLARDAAALGHRIVTLERFVQGAVLRGVREAEGFALRELRAGLHGLDIAFDALNRARLAIEHRIGELEHMVVNEVWAELRRLGDDLRPDRLIERLLEWLWGVVPGDVRTVLEWLWSILHEGAEFLAALIRGELPAPTTRDTGHGILRDVAANAKGYADELRRHL